MNKKILGIASVIIFGSLFFAGNTFAERDKEVGVVEGKKFQYEKSDLYYRLYTKPLFETISGLGLSPEWVSMDIFLQENKSMRDKYERIAISYNAGNRVAPEMYEGMTDYVNSGGLLITNNSLITVDANRNYKYDEGDTVLKRPGFETLGVFGHSGATIIKIRVEQACPLTDGLPTGEWVELESKVGGRRATNFSATVLVTSDGIYKNRPHRGPFLTYKHLGKGACIYIVPALSSSASKYKYISIILKNVFSEKVLEWVTTE